MKLKIGICDDREEELEQIRDLLRRAVGDSACEAELYCFRRSREIIEKIESDPFFFDMLFLDLYIDDRLGFDIAEMIRKKNRRCAVIFITAFADRMAESFRYLTSAYLVKPVDENSLKAAFRTALAHLDAAPAFHLHLKGEERAVPFDRNVYLESRLKDVLLFCAGRREPLVFRGRLSELGGLPAEYFHPCHKSFVVNFSYVSRVDKSAHEIVLRGGARIPVSRRYYRQIVGDFMEFHSIRRAEP